MTETVKEPETRRESGAAPAAAAARLLGWFAVLFLVFLVIGLYNILREAQRTRRPGAADRAHERARTLR